MKLQLCPRCKSETLATIISVFDTQTICIECTRKEREHPAYPAALKAERDAIRHGNYTFPGVGKPSDL
jgi:hypothetical protein